MDKLYRNVKTGETKPLPEKVYQAVKKHWEPVEEETVLGESPDITPPQISREDIISNEEIAEIIDETLETLPTEKVTKEGFQAQYEQLTGQKPDGRWSEKKLIQKIKELKGKQ